MLEDYTETSFQLRSTVLGGALIADIDQWGNRGIGHVYVGGELLADYQYLAPHTITTIQHRNPTTGQWVKNAVRTELDPLGADVGYINPYTYNLSYADIMGADDLYYVRGNALDFSGGCALDGLPISCSELQERMSSTLSTVSQEVTLTDNTVVTLPVRSEGPGIVRTWAPNPLATLSLTDLARIKDSRDPVLGLLNLLGHEELSSSTEPQNPAQPPIDESGVRQNIANRLTSDCKQYITNLINEAARQNRGNPAVSTNLLDIFDDVQRQGGFHRLSSGYAQKPIL